MSSPTVESALVTGAGGYVGATLCNHLVAAGVPVVGLDRLSRGRPPGLSPGLLVVRGDITDESAVHEALGVLPRVPEVCFHLAGAARTADSPLAPERFHHANTVGTQVVLQACLEAGVEGFVFASTAAVLQAPARAAEPLDEDCPVRPHTPYARSKLAAERTVQAATAGGRMTAVIARLFNPAGAAHGVAERHEPETHLLPLALAAVAGLRGPLLVSGANHPTPDGTCVRDYLHVADACEAMLRAVARRLERHRGGETGCDLYHLCSGRGRSVLEVLDAVGEVMGRPVPREAGPPRPGELAAVVGCPARMELLTGVRPRPSLAGMVRDAARALGLLPVRGEAVH